MGDRAHRGVVLETQSEHRLDVLFISPEISVGKIDVFIGWDAS